MLLLSINYFFSIVIITRAVDVATNLAPVPPSPAPATTPPPGPIQNLPKSIATVISDSGLTTQNANNSTATLNVIEKPDIKSSVLDVAPSNANSSVKTNIDPTTTAKETVKRVKDGEAVHTRKVSKTDVYPASLEQQTINKSSNASLSTVVSKIKANGSTATTSAAPSSPSVTKASAAANLTAAATTTTTASSAVPKPPVISNPVPVAKPPPTQQANSFAHKTANNTTITVTTTTETPKKPQITLSVEDDPQLKTIRDKFSKATKQSHGSSSAEANGALSEPIVLQSSELLDDDEYKTRDYIIPIIGLIFAVPIFLIIANFLSRRIRNYWSKRNYQRMDYLINEMYN